MKSQTLEKSTIFLKDCGDLRIGQSFRKRVLEDPKSGHFVIQTPDLLPTGRISSDLTPISTTGETPKTNVAEGDILIMSRGVRFNAGVIGKLPGPATAQNMFHILHLKKDIPLLPEFIAAYINHPSTQVRLKAFAKGKTVPHLKIADLGSLELPTPSVEAQKNYIALMDAVREEQELFERLTELREKQLIALHGLAVR